MTLFVWILVTLAFLSVAMTFAWRVALTTGQSGWIDAIWSLSVGTGGVVIALAPLAASDQSSRQVLVAGLCGVWSLRLGAHILLRTSGAGDDPRYAQLRKEWGPDHPRRLFWFLQIQAAAAAVLVLAVAAAAHNPRPAFDVSDWLAVVILGIAVTGEHVADRQLRDFKRMSKGKNAICDIGLWSWSRHPNYFFEWLAWTAYPLIAIDVGGGYLAGWLALVAPIFMYWLLVYVSGVPLLEAHMLRSRGDRFRDYQKRVSAFWPLPPGVRA